MLTHSESLQISCSCWRSYTPRKAKFGQSGELSLGVELKSNSGHLASLPGSCDKSPAGIFGHPLLCQLVDST